MVDTRHAKASRIVILEARSCRTSSPCHMAADVRLRLYNAAADRTGSAELRLDLGGDQLQMVQIPEVEDLELKCSPGWSREIPVYLAAAGLTRFARLTTALPAAGMSARPIRYRCRTFRAALWSALPDQPQSGFLHTNTAWDSRLPGVVKPHAEQRREVPGRGP